jgi:hypothetical protein
MMNESELTNCYFIYRAPKVKKVWVTKRRFLKLGPKIAGDVEFYSQKGLATPRAHIIMATPRAHIIMRIADI